MLAPLNGDKQVNIKDYPAKTNCSVLEEKEKEKQNYRGHCELSCIRPSIALDIMNRNNKVIKTHL